MLVKSLQVVVHAEHDTVWKLLLDMERSPERFQVGVTETHVIEKDDNTTVREMKLHGEQVKERVTIRPYESEICYELLEHPRFTGTIVKKVVRSARQSPVAPQDLEYHLELNLKSHKLKGVVFGEAEIVADLQEEMRRVKSRAEEMERRA